MYIKHVKKHAVGKCFVYLNNSESYRLASASSGAFEAICRAFSIGYEEDDIVIFGCELTEDFIAKHSYSIGFSDFSKFRKSKYIQSNIANSFIDVKKFLTNGKRVIFSGTPCQIMGLKMFLKKDYENLLLVDILCHGVPSQKAFSKYIEALERQYRSKVKNFTFRHKMKNSKGEWSNLNVRIELDKDKCIFLNCSEDMYMSSFLAGMLNRPSCENCLFATCERVSDFTIGDFWGIEQTLPELSELNTNGTSLLLVNSKKGESLEKDLHKNSILEQLPFEAAVPYNGQLSHPQKIDERSELFYSKINKKNGFIKGMRTYMPQRYGKKVLFRNKIYASATYQFLSRIKSQILSIKS
jgi:coenzyme F420-reducing hydrogenase beta subunit